MPKVAKQLSERAVAAIKMEGRHAVGGVPGLHLRVSAGHRGWVLRIQVGDKRRDIGIGAYPAVGLSEARDKARDIHDGLREGKDPIAPRKQQRMAVQRLISSSFFMLRSLSSQFKTCAGFYWVNTDRLWRRG
ncbi:Arm DNA-binding domain-containing protein [Acidovorax sp. SDU_ACID1]|uniref:Arm DNA-binding domain-containing protein n=1 Tax=Acidovorax sp. SDU_ACID1 TaxID=3136632 RepID=UPI0038732BE1